VKRSMACRSFHQCALSRRHLLKIGGMGMLTAVTSLTTQIQQRIPEELRGRVMALWSVCFIGSRPLAAAVNGSVADAWAPEAALVIVAVLLLAAALLTRPSRVGAATAPRSVG
jgi:predicted MFS family arabinose efflux permease